MKKDLIFLLRVLSSLGFRYNYFGNRGCHILYRADDGSEVIRFRRTKDLVSYLDAFYTFRVRDLSRRCMSGVR